MAMSGSASSTSTTGRSVVNEWRSSPLAGTTSTPPGKRARRRSRAAASSGVELVAGDQLVDLARLLLMLIPVVVRVVRDLLLLVVVERAAFVLLEDLVPDGLRGVALLRAHLAGREREDVVLDVEARDHAVREPAEVAALVLRGGVLAVLLHDLGEVPAVVDRLLDVVDLLQLIGERLEVAAAHLGRPDRDPGEVDLGRRRSHRDRLRLLSVEILQDVVAHVRLHVGDGEAVRLRALHERAVVGTLRLEELDDV